MILGIQSGYIINNMRDFRPHHSDALSNSRMITLDEKLNAFHSMKFLINFYDFVEAVCSIEFLQFSVLHTVFTLHFCKNSLSDAHS